MAGYQAEHKAEINYDMSKAPPVPIMDFDTKTMAQRYMPFQPKTCAMTPNGHLYFHASCFLDDYAQASVTNQHWFLHEMVKS